MIVCKGVLASGFSQNSKTLMDKHSWCTYVYMTVHKNYTTCSCVLKAYNAELFLILYALELLQGLINVHSLCEQGDIRKRFVCDIWTSMDTCIYSTMASNRKYNRTKLLFKTFILKPHKN